MQESQKTFVVEKKMDKSYYAPPCSGASETVFLIRKELG